MANPARYESSSVDVTPLGRPLKFEFSGREARNRFLKAAMTERLSSWSPTNHKARGIPSKDLINVYKRWGEGDFGLILTGNIMMEYDQLEAAGNPIIPRGDSPFEGERFDAFKQLAKAAKANGSLCVGQVSHPGRQCEKRIQQNPVSASDIQLEGNVMGMEFNKPHPASLEEIQNFKEGWAHAAEYLEKAGYDGIQLHGAHGYLLAQFLATTTNKRTDQYGGSLENRLRLIIEIAEEIRKRVSSSFMIGIKINSVEFQEGGFQPSEAKDLCKALEQNKFDFVELSGGTYENLAFHHKRESTVKREAFFLEFAELIYPALSKTRVYVTGGLKTAGAMVDALKTVDGVGAARPACQEPELPKSILSGKVQGAIKQGFDDQNFGLTNVVSGSFIKLLGRDITPPDASKEENVQKFMKAMEKWSEGMAEDKNFEKFGYVDLNMPTDVPYGVAAPLKG